MTTLIRRSPRIAEMNMKKQSHRYEPISVDDTEEYKYEPISGDDTEEQKDRTSTQINRSGSILEISLMITDILLTLVHLWYILN